MRRFASIGRSNPTAALGLPRKKTAAAVHEEIAREVDQWLHILFRGRRKTGHVDLEAVEMMLRSAMHQAGAAGLTALLQLPAPPVEQRTVACSCGPLDLLLLTRDDTISDGFCGALHGFGSNLQIG